MHFFNKNSQHYRIAQILSHDSFLSAALLVVLEAMLLFDVKIKLWMKMWYLMLPHWQHDNQSAAEMLLKLV
jgi:hypothetical protein